MTSARIEQLQGCLVRTVVLFLFAGIEFTFLAHPIYSLMQSSTDLMTRQSRLLHGTHELPTTVVMNAAMTIGISGCLASSPVI